MMIRWRGRQERTEPQVANASFDDADLSPASDQPAEHTRSNWAATLPDTDPAPLIWEEDRDGYAEREPEVWDDERRQARWRR